MDHATLKPTHAATDRGIAPSPSAGTSLASASALPVGTRLREFELTSVIGEGGFSIVYAAMDQRLGREVAIKEYIPASLARRDQGFSVRVRSEQHEESFGAGLAGFMNEARLLAQFKHPALVEVLQFWEENGTAYMVMPRYHGRTLRQVLRERGARCDEGWLKRTLAPVLDVLDLLHERSVFHRDIAPDNILIQRDDRAVLLDLGSAREILSDREQSVTVVVKPGYAPLEQYSGEFSLPQGPWTDVYAFGAVLHFAVTGAPPQASISRVMKDSRPLLAESPRPGFSERFLRGIDAALALQPAERPQSAAELRALLAFDEVHAPSADREAAERALDALHIDEAVTAIVSAEEMAGIAAQLAGGPAPAIAPIEAVEAAATSIVDASPTGVAPSPELPMAPPAQATKPTAASLDPMAAPAPAAAATVFKDVEDLAAGKLLPSTSDVRVVSESRLEARMDTDQPAEPSARALWPRFAALGTVLLMAGAGAWWLLQSPSDEASEASIASTQSELGGTPRASADNARGLDARGPQPTARSNPTLPSVPRAPGPSERLPALVPSTPARDIAPEPNPTGTEATSAATWIARPQPAAAIPDEVWAGDSSATREVDSQQLALVDLRNAPSSTSTSASSAGDPADQAPATNRIASAPAPRRTNNAAAELVGVRLSISPWAEVWLGAERKGVSPPVRELKLPPGRHQIELRNPAFPAKTIEIEVRAGENPAIEHRFSAEGA